jgi:hypothetical protein
MQSRSPARQRPGVRRNLRQPVTGSTAAFVILQPTMILNHLIRI